jgi:hypothetical protein
MGETQHEQVVAYARFKDAFLPQKTLLRSTFLPGTLCLWELSVGLLGVL